MVIGSERLTVQSPFVRYATEAGWTYVSPEDALDLRAGITSPVLDTLLTHQLQRFNTGILDAQGADEVGRQISRVRPSIDGNLDAWEYLRGLKTVFVAEERRERNLRLVDLDDLGRNTFHVTD